ncbi:MAG: ABC transporter permease, partial [Lachnospiraceae bacterium]|nr:ABC transporter permease [Lachnospiraceae bacterium]
EWIFKVNPLYSLIVMFRDAVFGRNIMTKDSYHLWYSLCFSFIIFGLGILVFWRKQDKFILYV